VANPQFACRGGCLFSLSLARVGAFSKRTKRTVIDRPFAETKELVAGFWLWRVQVAARGNLGQALPRSHAGEEAEIEIHQVFEAEDFGAEFASDIARGRVKTRGHERLGAHFD
jgi:hypothetical protein